MRIAITGGAGYIGCRLSEYFLRQGHTVDCIDWLKWGIEPVLNIVDNDNFNLHCVDICTPEVEPIIKQADAIIHLAGIIGFPACNLEPDLAYKVNVEGTKRIIDAALEKPFIYASTGSVYGSLDCVCTEHIQANPISTYAEYKLLGENYLNKTSVILRPATAFGVSNRLRHDLLINDFVRKACNNQSMILYEGHHKRTFLAVNDLVKAFAMALEQFEIMQGQVWNVGDNKLNFTKFEVCQIIKNRLPNWNFEKNTTLEHDQDGRNYFVDYSKIRTLDFYATESLEQGIDNLIKVYSAL
jgi:nucleoside-diphosphate-sugar epimerase